MASIRTLIALWFLSWASVASAQAQNPDLMANPALVSVECNFRVTNKVDCNEFIQGFFGSFDSVIRQEKNLEQAMYSLVVTDEALAAQQVRYSFQWKSKDQSQISDFTIPLILDQGMLDDVAILNSLIRNAGKGLVLYLDITTQETQDGKIVVVYQPKSDSDEPRKPDTWLDRLSKSPLFIGLDLNGSYRSSGRDNLLSSSLNGTVGGSLVYSKTKFKVDLSGYYSYRNATIPTGNGSLSGQSSVQGFNSVLVYSMTRRWSVAVINSVNSDPVSNINSTIQTGGGVEWTLVPFRTTENRELAFRVGGYHNQLNLGSVNELDFVNDQYMSAFAKIYYFWTLNEGKTTIRLNAGVDQNLKYKGFQNYSLGSTFTFQLNRAVRLNLNGSYSYAQRSLTYPKYPDFSNPVQVQQMKGQAGSNLNLSVGLNVTIGNSLKKTRDRRWAN